MAANSSVQLVPMTCIKCATPIRAEESDIAWACEKCEQGMLLTPDGLAPLTVKWASAKAATNVKWYPFWSFTGAVRFARRDTFGYGSQGEPDKLWNEPQQFFIPAYSTTLQELEDIGAELLKKRLRPTPSDSRPAAIPLPACALFPHDAQHAAEFVVLTIEAERRDKLKSVEFILRAGEPELWVLPFRGEAAAGNLALG
jgi:hypothetical protein